MTVSRPEDRAAIHDLVATYGDAVSRRDAEAWGATWAADATWSLMGTQVSGRDAIVALWTAAMTPFEAVSFIACLGPITFDIDGDRASARCQTQEVLKSAEGVRRVAGIYEDRFVREYDRWLFERREFSILIEH